MQKQFVINSSAIDLEPELETQPNSAAETEIQELDQDQADYPYIDQDAA